MNICMHKHQLTPSPFGVGGGGGGYGHDSRNRRKVHLSWLYIMIVVRYMGTRRKNVLCTNALPGDRSIYSVSTCVASIYSIF